MGKNSWNLQPDTVHTYYFQIKGGSGKDCSNGGTPSKARARSQLSISTRGFKTQKQKNDKKQIIRQSTAPQEKHLRRQAKVNRAEF